MMLQGLGSIRKLICAQSYYADQVSTTPNVPAAQKGFLSAGKNSGGFPMFNHQARYNTFALSCKRD